MIGRAAKTVLRHSRQMARPSRRVCPFCLEAEHIGGRNHIPHVTVDVCQAHHVLVTEERLAAGAEMKRQPHPIKTVEMAIRSLVVTGRAITSAMGKLCEALEFCAEMLKGARR
jgi:hypothetical protein